MIDLGVDLEQLRRDQDREARRILGASAGAVRDATKALERKLEEKTRQAVPGKLWRAWASKAFPRQGIAKEPVGSIFVKGGARSQGAMDFFTRPGRIKGRAGGGVAIPTAAAGPRGRARLLTPREWEARTGVELRFVPGRRGGKARLVAEGTTNGRSGVFRPITRARTRADDRRGFQRGVQTVTIFVIMPFVDFANKFSIEPIVRGAQADMVRDFERRAATAGQG
ncbi:DUF6441 family protein [Sphingomonas sp. 1P06PA]|uniref:DUF6441 family protein n=1 Tax=Sphingomonas sp. 1P06PA TaxID=554121 RepID=UPI0039A643EE